MATKVATPWGWAVVVEEITIPQAAGEKTFSSIVQLLEGEAGANFVRFAYTTGGAVRRGPVTLRMEDLEQLRDGLREQRALARTLGLRPR